MKAVLATLAVLASMPALAYETSAQCSLPPMVAPNFQLSVTADNTTGFDISTFDSTVTPPTVMTVDGVDVKEPMKAVSSQVKYGPTVSPNPNGTSIEVTTYMVRFEKADKSGFTAYCSQQRMLGE